VSALFETLQDIADVDGHLVRHFANSAGIGGFFGVLDTVPGDVFLSEHDAVLNNLYGTMYMNRAEIQYIKANDIEGASLSLSHYCPKGSDHQTLCPFGTYYEELDDVHETLSDTCFDCPAGHYCSSSDRTTYGTCSAGYICSGAATTPTPTTDDEGGYVCPKGYYCVAGAVEPAPCPPGTYGSITGLSSEDSCSSCLPGAYNHLYGQAACFTCGASSYSTLGSQTCECTGSNRSFQTSDGSCLCYPGYEFYDDSQTLSEGDSVIDCSKVVYERCDNGRDSNGNCIVTNSDGTTTLCASQCTSGEGTVDTNGYCVCSDVADPVSVCGTTCLSERTDVSVSADGSTLTFTDPTTGDTTTIDTASDESFFGTLYCTDSSCSAYPMTNDGTDGYTGAYKVDVSNYDSSSDASTKDTTDVTGIEQPVVCLSLYESLVWDVSETHYPVYVKDSLFNTNSAFDYGLFRQLARRLSASAALDHFAFTFTQAGTYCFADAANENKLQIIKVMPEGSSCADDRRIYSLTPDTLSLLSVSASTDIILAPYWSKILLIAGGGFLVVIGIVGLLVYISRKNLAAVAGVRPKYRRLGSTLTSGITSESDAAGVASRTKASVGLNAALGLTQDEPLDRDLPASDDTLEGFSVKTLFDKLEDQTHLLAHVLDNQNEDMSEALREMAEERDSLRALLDEKLSSLQERQEQLGDRLTKDQQQTDREREERKEKARHILSILEVHSSTVNIELQARRNADTQCRTLAGRFLALRDEVLAGINQELSAELDYDIEPLSEKMDELLELSQSMASSTEAKRRGLDSQAPASSLGGVLHAALRGKRHTPVAEELLDDRGRPQAVKGISVDGLDGIVHPAMGTYVQLPGSDTNVPMTSSIHREWVVLPHTAGVAPMCEAVLVDRSCGRLVYVSDIVDAQDSSSLIDYVQLVPCPTGVNAPHP
ncbi:hypothetical protein KIPB_007457, partial [Kipferlia bialata]